LDFGFLTTGLLTGLREGVEAALIVSIILAYLAKTGNARHFGKIWIGTLAAIAVSAGVGVILFVTIGGLKEPAEQIFEGAAMLLAAAVVTWMLFWMRRTAASVKGELQASVDRRLVEGSVWGLAILAFTAVIREGIETSLFLMAQAQAASQADGNAFSTLIGAVVGLAIAAIIGYGFYRGARVINLRTFFQWTGVALVFIAAGLLSHGIHEFIEAGVISVGTATAFDISGFLSHDEGLGQWLRAIFGYSADPEWFTFVAWLGYIVIVLVAYLRPVQPRPVEARPTQKVAGV
jgi:high-affinity iron transporter